VGSPIAQIFTSNYLCFLIRPKWSQDVSHLLSQYIDRGDFRNHTKHIHMIKPSNKSFIRIFVLIIQYSDWRLFYATICAFSRHFERAHTYIVHPIFILQKISTTMTACETKDKNCLAIDFRTWLPAHVSLTWQLIYVSFFSLHTWITGNVRYVHGEKRALSTGSSIHCLLISSLRWKESNLCISDNCRRRGYKCALLALLFTFLLSFIFIASAFTHLPFTSILLGHYWTIIIIILFVFSLPYSNYMFPYESSLP
jgi:hypothetical protein